jgi:EAL domain-containing protein (putative c-di-GMP-specific phosphodiesterase class I)
VEDYETFVLLGALGVDFAQGYFLGKPAATLGNALPAALLAMPKGPARRRARAR